MNLMMILAGCQGNIRYDDLLQRNTPVLESVAVIIHVMVEIVGVGEKLVVTGEDERCA